jgi:hypothetical protein
MSFNDYESRCGGDGTKGALIFKDGLAFLVLNKLIYHATRIQVSIS